MSEPKVSVVIPTYNRINYLARAIESALRQTYSNIEIVVVDDGSTDKTEELLKKYVGRIVYIYQPNQGAASARNKGIDAAKGEFIAFLDSDDYFYPDNVEKKIDRLFGDQNCGWIHSNWQYVSPDGGILENGAHKFRHNNKCVEGEIFPELLKSRNFIATDSVVISKEILTQTGGFDDSIPSQEEYDLWLRLAIKNEVRYISEPLLYVTRQSGSLSSDFMKWAQGNARIIEKLHSLLPIDFENRDGFLRRSDADKYTFLGRAHFEKREYIFAARSFLRSILRLPKQRKVYLLLFQSLIGLLKNTGSLHRYDS